MNGSNILQNVYDINRIARESGAAILEIYNSDDIELQMKESDTDGFVSPLTKADTVSHEIIVSELTTLYPDIPVISEEQDEALNREIAGQNMYWIIDPIDGTKGFVKRDGEFTINIALIINKQPVVGVVYVPVHDQLYYTADDGAWLETATTKSRIHVSDATEVKHVVASKNHLEDTTRDFIAQFGDDIELIQAGSSLKICKVATGEAELYPRLSPTSMEWDIAAADAVLRAAGGTMLDETGKVLEYGKLPELRNSGFLATNSVAKFTLQSQ